MNYRFTAAALVNTPSGGSPITQQQVRDAMLLAPTVTSIAENSIDDKLDDLFEDIPGLVNTNLSSNHGGGAWGAGAGGANTIIINTVDGSAIPIPNVQVSIYNAGGGIVASCITDANGNASLNIGSAVYTFKSVKAGYNINTLVWDVPTAGLTVTITGSLAVSVVVASPATKVIDIVSRALRLLTVQATNESVDSPEGRDALQVLNLMVDSWNNEKLFTYVMKNELFNITGGIGSYTIGSGGDWNTTRPVRIENAFVRDAVVGYNNDYNLQIIPNDRYNEIFQKALQTTYPQFLYYSPDYPLGTVKLWPVPIRAMTINISQWSQISKFASLYDEIILPMGYEGLLCYGLAYELAPEYNIDPNKFRQQLGDAKAAIYTTNQELVLLSTDTALRSQQARNFNIWAGLSR